MTRDRKRHKWNVRRALRLMQGTEHACRLLLADLDREIVDRDSFGITDGPRAIGIAVVTTVQCALFCEYAIKTFHASLSNGYCRSGHWLARRSPSEKKGLYDNLEERYMAVETASPGDLSNLIIEHMNSREACCPTEWTADIADVRRTLQIGSGNFEEWRYGYAENGRLSGGAPKGLFVVAKGLELLTRSRLKDSLAS